MIKLPRHPDYQKNSDRIDGDDAPCAICGKAIKSRKAKIIRIHGGGDLVVTNEEAWTMDDAADLGFYPIGPECIRKHPELKPYLQE